MTRGRHDPTPWARRPPPGDALAGDALAPGAPVDAATAGVLEETIEVPLRADVLAARITEEDAERSRRQRRRRRLTRLAITGATAACLVAGAAFLVGMNGRTQREIDERVAAADERIAEGRLTGGDAALDHLVAARALRPADPAVRERLRLLADKLEALGEAAAARGDLAEAAVHLTAASQAEPDRESIHLRLGEIAAGRRSARPDAGGGGR